VTNRPSSSSWMPALCFIAVTGTLVWVALWMILKKIGMMPLAAAYEAVLIDGAFDGMLKLTLPLYGYTVSGLIASVVFFRSRGEQEEGLKFEGSRGRWLEISWISLSLLLTGGLAAFGVKEFKLIRGTDQADVDIQVTASQFSWDFFYPATNIQSSKLILPKGKRVRLLLTSKDVVHAFWVPQFRVKQDAVPGKVVKLLFTPTVTGSYTLLCAELCGEEHTIMTAFVEVVEPEAFEGAMKEQNW